MKNIALFNSFPFHYEVMGHFIYYCQQRKHSLFIFTETKNNFGWLDFYVMLFAQSNYFFTILPSKDLNKDMIYMMDKIYISTDDDPHIPSELLLQPHKYISLCHHQERMDLSLNLIPILPAKGKKNNFVLPVFPLSFELFPTHPVVSIEIQVCNILLIGNSYTTEEINNLHKMQENRVFNKKIQLHWIGRFKPSNIAHHIFFYEKASAFTIFHLCRKCDFLYHPQNVEILQEKKISAVLFIGLSSKIPLILPSIHRAMFSLKSPIYVEKLDSLPLSLKNYKKNTILLENDQERILQQNHKILDKYFGIKEIPFPFMNNSLGVNPLIHFVWFDKKTPKTMYHHFPTRYQHNIQTFQLHNPWATIKIWNYQDVVNLIKENQGMQEYLQFMEKLPSNQQKCDIGRILIVYLLGGLYMDMDFWCVRDLSNLLKNKEIAFSYEPNEHNLAKFKLKKLVCNSLFYSRDSQSPKIKAWLDYIVLQYPGNKYGSAGNAFFSVGPFVLSQFLFLKENLFLMNYILPSYYFIPITNKCVFSLEKQTLGKDKPIFAFTRWKDGTDHGNKKMLLYNHEKNKENFGLFLKYPDMFQKFSLLYPEKDTSEKTSLSIKTYVLVILIFSIVLLLLFLYHIFLVYK